MNVVPSADHVELFELELQLPDAGLDSLSKRLIGFEARYDRIRGDLRLLSHPDDLREWSQKFHKKVLPLVDAVADRYPLIVFEGDVGTGKTATAEASCNRLAQETNKPSMLFKLSTRVRGDGKVGHMSMLINEAFQVVAREAGKSRTAFLILDEADSLAAARDTDQSHHEDKVAVNTLIQKIDDIRKFGGRLLVFLCTNRFSSLDPAVVRRVSRIETFQRPNEAEREQLFRMDCEGVGLSEATIKKLVSLTGPTDTTKLPGFTYSDLRNKLLPQAIAYAFPSRQLTEDDFLKAAHIVTPSPSMNGSAT